MVIPKNGSFVDHTVAALFQEIYADRGTGCLTINAGEGKKELFFTDGCLSFVTSNLEEDCIENYLLRIGQLTPDQMKEVRSRCRKTGKPQGAVLVEMKVVAPKKLFELVQLLTKDLVFDLFSWGKGDFTFESGKKIPPEAVPFKVGFAQLVLEEFRTVKRLVSWIPILEEGEVPVWSLNPLLRYQDVSPSDSEKTVFDLIDGNRSLEEIAAAAELSTEAVTRTILALRLTGMISLAKQKPSQKPKPAKETKPVSETAPAAGKGLSEEILNEYQRLKNLDYYQLLEVERTATPQQVKTSYLKLAKKYHPDRHFSDEEGGSADIQNEIFSLVNEAYQTLTDPELKRQYDRGLASGAGSAKSSEGPDNREIAASQFQKGKNLARDGDFEPAAAAFRAACHLDPDQHQYHATLAVTLMRAKTDLHEAEEHLKTAISQEPENADYHFYLGKLYQAGGATQKAMEALKKALVWDMDHSRAREALAEIEAESQPKKRKRLGFKK